MKNLLILGCGDVARRALPGLAGFCRISAVARSADTARRLTSLGVRPIAADLDEPETLACLGEGVDLVLHSAPPQGDGQTDRRTRHLIAALERGGMVPQRFVYLSTSGVYGDCGGAFVSEARPPRPGNDRARRRADAEACLQAWCAKRGVGLVVLRIPGLYAADRLPLERLRRGRPALNADDDVYTNHVHADDLAAMLCVALQRSDVSGTFNASDDSELRMGEYFDLVADRTGLPRPPRISRLEAERELSPLELSFFVESRRLQNARIKEVLGIRLRYPTVFEGVPAA